MIPGTTSGSAQHAPAIAKNTATAGPAESPVDKQRTNAAKSATASPSDASNQQPSSVPAQTPLLDAVSAAQALNPAQPPTIPAGSNAGKISGIKTAETGGPEDAAQDAKAGSFAEDERPNGIRRTQASEQGTAASIRSEVPDTDSPSGEPAAQSGPFSAAAHPLKDAEPLAASKAVPIISGQQLETYLPTKTAAEIPVNGEGPGKTAVVAVPAESRGSQSHARSSTAGKPGSSSGPRASAINPAKQTHTSVGSATAMQANRLADVQQATAARDNSDPSAARDLAGLRGTTGTAASIPGDSSSTISGAASRDTFSALDAESASRTSTWTHAGATRAEAGYQDPSLGWVSVRADAGGGGIHASLVPSSADAAQALGGHLAGLNAHLAEQHMSVETLTLAAPEGRGLDTAMGQNANQNMQQQTGQGLEPSRPSDTNADVATVAAVQSSSTQSSARGIEATLAANSPPGAHISVMA